MIHNMRRPVPALLVSAGQREVLESVARSPSAPHREVVRARALLMAADGLANTAIARALSVSPASVSGWRARFAEEGLVKFAQVRQGRGRKKTIPQEKAIVLCADEKSSVQALDRTQASLPMIKGRGQTMVG